MATTKMDALATAIYGILLATGLFKSGTPFARKEVGARPSFMVWWDGLATDLAMRSDQGPGITTHKFQVDIYSSLTSDPQESQRQLWLLVEGAIAALKADHRLGGQCLRSRVTSASPDVLSDGNNPLLATTITLEADCMAR